MLNYVNGASFQHLRRIFDEPKITEMAHKYRFSETKKMKGLSGKTLYVCEIRREDDPDNYAIISSSIKSRFESIRAAAMKGFADEGKLAK